MKYASRLANKTKIEELLSEEFLKRLDFNFDGVYFESGVALLSWGWLLKRVVDSEIHGLVFILELEKKGTFSV